MVFTKNFRAQEYLFMGTDQQKKNKQFYNAVMLNFLEGRIHKIITDLFEDQNLKSNHFEKKETTNKLK